MGGATWDTGQPAFSSRQGRFGPALSRTHVFYTQVRVENITRRSQGATLAKVLVDTGSEYSWVPADVLESLGIKREKKDLAFLMANGTAITRSVGFAIVRVGHAFTVDEVVFGEPGDQQLLGARSLEGLNLAVDTTKRRLVAAGPLPAA
jgi:predicted aspartyl protease